MSILWKKAFLSTQASEHSTPIIQLFLKPFYYTERFLVYNNAKNRPYLMNNRMRGGLFAYYGGIFDERFFRNQYSVSAI